MKIRRGESFGQSQLWDYWLYSYRPVPCSPAGRGEERRGERERERGEKGTEKKREIMNVEY